MNKQKSTITPKEREQIDRSISGGSTGGSSPKSGGSSQSGSGGAGDKKDGGTKKQ